MSEVYQDSNFSSMKLVFVFIILISFSPNIFGNHNLNQRLFTHAINTPDTLNKDLDELITYLIEPTTSKKEQIEIISYWICLNIEYDVEGLSIDKYNNTGWASVLITKKTICQGYAELFKEFCDRINVDCFIVTGYAKGYKYYSGYSFSDTNHAWNVILIDSDYVQFDLTWASGGVSGKDPLVYIKSLDSSYLFADPEYFIIDHLPAQPRWQLLEYPFSMESFINYESYDEHISDDSKEYFNYKDSIKHYGKLGYYDKLIKDLEDEYYFYPIEIKCAEYNMYLGYYLSFGKYDDERYTKAIDHLNIAMEVYQNPHFNKMESIDFCEKTIKYINYRLRSGE